MSLPSETSAPWVSTSQIGAYLQQLTWANANERSSPVPIPPGFSQNLVQDCHHLTHRILEAYRSPHTITLPWSVEEYAERLTKQQNMQATEQEEALRREFPPLYPEREAPLADSPVMVVDNTGIIVLWYLPGALTRRRAASLYAGVKTIDTQLEAAIKVNSDGATSDRMSTFYPSPDETLKSGELSISPAWFPIAHPKDLRSSPFLRTGKGKDFMISQNESLSLMAAITWVIHPPAADRGGEIMQAIQQGRLKEECVKKLGRGCKYWPSPYTAIGFMTNKETIMHRDGKGLASFYDLLATVGEYINGHFYSSAVGVSFRYDPGTMIAVTGKILPHGVSHVDGNRACIAQYFHLKALEYHEKQAEKHGYQYQDLCQWMKTKTFRRGINTGHWEGFIDEDEEMVPLNI